MTNPPSKHPEMITRTEQPLNAESPPQLLRRSFTTPTELFFVRNHGSIPEIDAGRYRLSVTGMVQQQLHLSLRAIRRWLQSRGKCPGPRGLSATPNGAGPL
jgi:sulfite oxidase